MITEMKVQPVSRSCSRGKCITTKTHCRNPSVRVFVAITWQWLRYLPLRVLNIAIPAVRIK